MISEANQVALQAAGLSFILGTRLPHLPGVVREWRDKHPDEVIPDGLVLSQPWPATSSEKACGIPDRVIYYQFRHDRAAEQCAASMNRSPRPNALSTGMPGQTQSLHPAHRRQRHQDRQPGAGGQDPRPGRVEGLHHQPHRGLAGVRHRRLPPALAHREELPHVQARPASPPIYHHLRESIEAHLSIVVTALAVSHYIEAKQVGASRNSSAPPDATAPSKSRPATTTSPPPTHYPTTSATRSPRSAPTVRTNLSQLGTRSPAHAPCAPSLRRR
ncbi:putative transposase [Mycobacterium xenopi 3993]|nr:putative transposase [Mycobacterium xenopi 3993]